MTGTWRSKRGIMQVEKKELHYDYVVVGGGLSGICAAIAAARLGLRTALVNNRSYVGGNAGAEVYVAVNGATGTSEFNFFAREDGIIEEILLENLHRNPAGNRFIWDALLIDMIYSQDNLDLYQNTTVYGARMEGGRIISVSALSSVSEEQYEIYAEMFTDDTGDGTLGYLAGAEYMVGREGRAEYNESIAPEQADHWVLPSTLIFIGKDTGKPVRYIPPKFAMDIHKTKLLTGRVIPPDQFARHQWYYELGGDRDQTRDYVKIMDEHRAFAYGVWDYIKNSGQFPAENYDLEYVASMPGKREWRRIKGDVVLTERDIVEQTQFNDVIAFGGWSIDLHALEGIYSDDIQNRHYILKGIFRIPFRSCYSVNVENLTVASRCMSVTHVAHGSTRLIATLSMIGQAVGTAAWICCRDGITPRRLYETKIDELKRTLGRYDHTIPGTPYRDPMDLAQNARVRVSSERKFGCLDVKGFRILDENAALVYPAGGRTPDLRIRYRARKDTSLTCAVYLPSNYESYNPETLVWRQAIPVSAVGEEGDWLTLGIPDRSEYKNRYIFLEFEANPEIELAYGDDQPGVISLVKKPNERTTTWDAVKKCRKEFFYRPYGGCICFEAMGAGVYGAENLNNGYRRPYRAANLWVSGKLGSKPGYEWIEIELQEAKHVTVLVITFDSGLNRRYVNTRMHDFDVMPELVRDYDVYVRENGEYRLAGEIRGNYQRVGRVDLRKEGKAVKTDCVRIVIRSTNGVDCARVYAVSLYE